MSQLAENMSYFESLESFGSPMQVTVETTLAENLQVSTGLDPVKVAEGALAMGAILAAVPLAIGAISLVPLAAAAPIVAAPVAPIAAPILGGGALGGGALSLAPVIGGLGAVSKFVQAIPLPKKVKKVVKKKVVKKKVVKRKVKKKVSVVKQAVQYGQLAMPYMTMLAQFARSIPK